MICAAGLLVFFRLHDLNRVDIHADTFHQVGSEGLHLYSMHHFIALSPRAAFAGFPGAGPLPCVLSKSLYFNQIASLTSAGSPPESGGRR